MPPQAPRQPRTTGQALTQAALASLAVVAICAAKPADRTYTPTPTVATVATVPMPRSSKPGELIEVAPTAAAPSGRPRVALVLANGQYSAPAEPLPQAHPDAWRMADALAASGFDVRVLEDGDKRAMELALVDLVRRAQQTGGAEAALVYYAGHGAKVPVPDGVLSVLVPLDADGGDEATLAATSLPLSAVQEKLVATKAEVLIAVVDACRDNPYLAAWMASPQGRDRALHSGGATALRGAVSAPAPQGVGVSLTWAFATSAGSVAKDGLYTPALATRLRNGCGELNRVFGDVSAEVRRSSANRQAPELTMTSSGQRFVFRDDGSCPPPDGEWKKHLEEKAQLAMENAQLAREKAELERKLAETEQASRGDITAPPSPRRKARASRASQRPPPKPHADREATQVPKADASISATTERWKTWGPADYPMVPIPAATFLMGSPPTEPGRGLDEQQHKVMLVDSYLMGQTEVTQGLWKALNGSNPSPGDNDSWFDYNIGDALPVRGVSWCNAVDFANRLSMRDGLPAAYSGTEECVSTRGASVVWHRSSTGYRLPTEAEWEFAARAFAAGPFAGSSTLSDACTVGNVADRFFKWMYRRSSRFADNFNCWDGVYRLAPVGKFEPNEFGLFDMTGNVAEWCWDVYGDYQDLSISFNPTGTEVGERRVIRGGSYYDKWPDARIASRNHYYAVGDADRIGLRLVRTMR